MTPRQLSMARAAIRCSMDQLSNAIGISKQAISAFERGDESRISLDTEGRIEQWFVNQCVYFGPGDSVSYGIDRYGKDQNLIWALLGILGDHGLMPASSDIVERMHDLEPKSK